MKKNIKVVKIQDKYTLVLNIGSDDHVREGQLFLIYRLGEEIFDPDTNESLGHLEIVSGIGKVTHLQPKMCTITSNTFTTPVLKETIKEIPHNSLFIDVARKERSIFTPKDVIPFNKPAVGDYARPIESPY
ncbi:hypothetical protein [uncultured Veillonella sp.]|uniref:hypothetical protein n=1 Tax=uncultured Veillonella sp. TaxID=159268 RepID=UPI0025953B99|nr:hypothetical protein [uncultured Veillonella sp.]